MKLLENKPIWGKSIIEKFAPWFEFKRRYNKANPTRPISRISRISRNTYGNIKKKK